MSLYNTAAKPRSEELADIARLLSKMGSDTFDVAKARYSSQYNTLWHSPNIASVAECQEVLDALGPGESARVFQDSYALGVMLNTIVPGTISAEKLAPPVPYTAEPIAEGIRIVLDPNATYPGPIAE